MEHQFLDQVTTESIESTLTALSVRCREQLNQRESPVCQVSLYLANGAVMKGVPYRVVSAQQERVLYLSAPSVGTGKLEFSLVPVRQITAMTIHEAQTVLRSISQGAIPFNEPKPSMNRNDVKAKIESANSPVRLEIDWNSIGDTPENFGGLSLFVDAVLKALNKIGSDQLGKSTLAAFSQVLLVNAPEKYEVTGGKIVASFPLEKSLPLRLEQKIEQELLKKL